MKRLKFDPSTAFILIAIASATGCSSSSSQSRAIPAPSVNGLLDVRNARVSSVVPKSDGAIVNLEFEVFDANGIAENSLEADFVLGNFRVVELDSTDNTLRERDPSEIRRVSESDKPLVPVVVLLDSSDSMRRQLDSQGQVVSAMPDLRTAAIAFDDELAQLGRGFDPIYYQFSEDIVRLQHPSEIDSFQTMAGTTSLYSAIAEAMARHPNTDIVVFTDGADSSSDKEEQYQIRQVSHLQNAIRDSGIVVNAIGLGVLSRARDTAGIEGERALRMLSTDLGGHYEQANAPNELIRAFVNAADRVASKYRLSYYSLDRLDGEYGLYVVAEDNERTGRSQLLRYTVSQPPSITFTSMTIIPNTLLRITLVSSKPLGVPNDNILISGQVVAALSLVDVETSTRVPMVSRIASSEIIVDPPILGQPGHFRFAYEFICAFGALNPVPVGERTYRAEATNPDYTAIYSTSIQTLDLSFNRTPN